MPGDVMSQEEIDALLAAVAGGEVKAEDMIQRSNPHALYVT